VRLDEAEASSRGAESKGRKAKRQEEWRRGGPDAIDFASLSNDDWEVVSGFLVSGFLISGFLVSVFLVSGFLRRSRIMSTLGHH
jgi:hypothetical protein